jgi:hypothetical protein
MNEPFLRRDDNDNWILHHYPFSTLLPIESHLHPQFVIFDVGRKMKKLQEPTYTKLSNNFPSLSPLLRKIIDLYSAWDRDIPDSAHNDVSYIVPNDDDSDDPKDDDKDDKDKDFVEGSVQSRRRFLSFEAELPSPPIPPRRNPVRSSQNLLSQVKSNTEVHPFLSEVTLFSHNQQIGKATWTNDRIREWCARSEPLRKKRKHMPSHSFL